jgi:hypothetical protein
LALAQASIFDVTCAFSSSGVRPRGMRTLTVTSSCLSSLPMRTRLGEKVSGPMKSSA